MGTNCGLRLLCCFFFSSRRRHTRLTCDWSSDVCSSDLGYANPDKMCLYGHSNGGGVADYLVTQTGRFKCAVVVAPVLPNWMGSALLQTGSWGLVADLAGTKLWDDPLAYVKLSAVARANRVKTPMLIAVGDEDGQFLLGAIEMYNALRFAGADVTLLRYPRQGHVFTGTGLQDFWRRYMDFFRNYLGPNKSSASANH